MRFYRNMIKVAERLTGMGYVVLMPFVTVAPAEQEEGLKVMLDEMHRQKIDMADGVAVVSDRENVYIGESTNAEIQYAMEHGKRIEWMLEDAC
jgi:hypothetical protein